ncbi:uncharacterized protein LOC143257672 [Tachypleus tridentatus]|uniref:uncharacterized protein LOC143257672 n=1 Tax=Tachypleus tridentatus TaxID=6853 RepID=UPI003FCF83B8
MQHYLLPKKRQQVDGPTNTCGASEDSGDRDGENADTTIAGPQPQEVAHTLVKLRGPSPMKEITSLKSHDNSAGYKFAMHVWTEFKLQKTKGARIQHAFNTNHAKTVEENRHDIRAVIDALLYTVCQKEAQRGHREGSQSDNKGNFLELLDMISRYDEIVKKKLSGPGNAKYMHHDIQNELLDIIAGMIRKDISKEVMEAEHFALMVDETKDVNKQEQLSIVVRYLHQQSLHEEFLDFTAAEEFLKVQKELEPVNQHIELKRLSDTRWACQHAACLAGKRTLPAIVTTLKCLVDGDNVHRASESKGLCILLHQQFVTSLVAMEKLLLMTKQLSDYLQSPNLQLASAEDLVQSVISDLSEMELKQHGKT